MDHDLEGRLMIDILSFVHLVQYVTQMYDIELLDHWCTDRGTTG